MGSLSNYAEDAILDHVLGNTALTAPTSLYIGLSTATIDDTTTGSTVTEPGDTYARVETTSGDWDAAASRATSNANTETFPQASGSWGTITDWFIADASSGGNIIAYGTLGTSKAVVAGNTPSFAAGELDVSVDASGASGGWTTVLVNEVLDHVFMNGAYTQPTLACALYTASPTDAGGGTECANANNYSRTADQSGNFDAASGGASQNTAAISFATPSGSWGTVVAAALCSSATYGTGDPLLYGDVTSQEPTNGDTVEFPIGDFDVTLA